MTTNGMTIIEKQFMETMMRNTNRIADALEETNKLKQQELEARKEDRKLMQNLIEAIDGLNKRDEGYVVYDDDDDPSALY